MIESFFYSAAVVAGGVAVVLTVIALGLALVGPLARAASRTPGLDVAVSTFTWGPWVVCGVVAGWAGVVGALVGQAVALGAWTTAHELIYRKQLRGQPRIVAFINAAVGRWRNHAALWVTMIALPGFLFIRVLQIVCYPMLVWLLRFPRYDQREWINVSRQKFSGLIGHDLIWCLYCDWMTGVYALGAEMLRNVESFWCPIRFYDGKKCENCRTDFPDVTGGWVAADGTMADVDAVLKEKYGDGRREWFGHPARLTVKGKELEPRRHGEA